MKKILKLLFVAAVIFCLSFNPVIANAETDGSYILGGFPIGIQIQTRGAYVVSIDEVICSDGVVSPARDAGINTGDIILSVDGKDINSNSDLFSVLSAYDGGELIIEIERQDEKIIKNVTPCKDVDGNVKLGISVRDNLTGIGTVTCIDLNGNFVALGHPVIDGDGKNVEIVDSKVFNCSIYGIIKGRRGHAGELQGIILEDEVTGKLIENTPTGIYGKFDKSIVGKKYKLGNGKIGKASIFACVDGTTVKEYSISIVKSEKNSHNKDYVVKITDKELLNLTGGIVQGMSGSPIVQSGKIVGAITHVFINDPTRGFGICASKILPMK